MAVLKIIKTEIAAVLVVAHPMAQGLLVAHLHLNKDSVEETVKSLEEELLAVVEVLVLKVWTVLMAYK